jgi:hypothetical protein
MDKQGTIFLFQDAWGNWITDSSQTPDAARHLELFGTNLLPTAFCAPMPAADVVARIAKLNPNRFVEVRS